MKPFCDTPYCQNPAVYQWTWQSGNRRFLCPTCMGNRLERTIRFIPKAIFTVDFLQVNHES